MPQRRILFLDSSHLTAYQVGGGMVHAEGEFPADAAGIEAFGEYLAHRRGSVFQLLTDVAEEGFQFEDIPHSTGKDRAALVKRKLAQHFYGTPFALAVSQGRRKTGRRDEHLLLMALTRPQHLEPWLAALHAAQAVLAGMHSLPQTVGNLLTQDMPKHVLIITLTRGGLRQTFFDNGRLRFSRLSAIATGVADESAAAAALEAAKMHQYLLGQRLIERGKPLETRILAHPAQIDAMRARCYDTDELHFGFIDLWQEAQRAGLRTPLADSRADMLFCHLLVKKTPADQFASNTARQFHRLWQIRLGLQVASGLILASGLLFAAKQTLDVLGHQEKIRQIEQQTRFDQQQYDAALRTLPAIPLSTDNLRALVDRYDAVKKRAAGPQPLLVQLSHTLDAFPDIEIERIEWRITEQSAALPGNAAASLPPGMTGTPYAEAVVEARLPLALVGNQRSQLARVAAFAKHLGTPPDTRVAILQQPVDTQSGRTLKSSDEKHTLEAPRFSFRLTRKL